MAWLQLIADVKRGQIDALEQAILKAGAISITLSEQIPEGEKQQPILEPDFGDTPLWGFSRLTALFAADCNSKQVEWLLTQLLVSLPQIRWERLKDKDWEREWMNGYQPIQCSANFWVCPSWAVPPDPQAINLLLDPGLAFGTGAHPTTFLCLQWLAEQTLKDKTLIDYGCGSGILGIAALLLGAKKAVGIDIDPQAHSATQQNVSRNQLQPEQFPVYLPDACECKRQVDLIVANILSGTLTELAPRLINQLKIGGHLCLSGILETQTAAVLNTYEKHIAFEPISQKDEWVRIAGHRYR